MTRIFLAVAAVALTTIGAGEAIAGGSNETAAYAEPAFESLTPAEEQQLLAAIASRGAVTQRNYYYHYTVKQIACDFAAKSCTLTADFIRQFNRGGTLTHESVQVTALGFERKADVFSPVEVGEGEAPRVKLTELFLDNMGIQMWLTQERLDANPKAAY